MEPPSCVSYGRQELIENVAVYLASFTNNAQEADQKRDYLVNNGLIRMLLIDDALREEVREIA